MKKISGIYCIENKINGKKYVGRAKDIEQRFCNHVSQLKQGKHLNKYMQDSWLKYGEDGFVFYILEECSQKDSFELEKEYILKLRTKAPDGYNLTDGGEGSDGRIVSSETREKISKSNMGRESPRKGAVLTQEVKDKISNSKTGNTYITEETRNKISMALKGMFSGSNNPMFGKSPFLNKKHSEDSKKKISETKHKNPRKREKATSKYIGVCYSEKRNKWESTIYYNSKKKRIGYFSMEEEAAQAYDIEAIKIFGTNCKTNFPISCYKGTI